MVPLTQNPSSRGPNPRPSQQHNNRNYGAAFFHMMTIALLCTSLVQPSWLTLNITKRSSVSQKSESCPRHLTLYQFLDNGYFETANVISNGSTNSPVKLFYHSSSGSEYIEFIKVTHFEGPKLTLFYSYGMPYSIDCQLV